MTQHAFSLSDTIAAIATPPGASARAMVRIAGEGTRAVLHSLGCVPTPADRGCFRVIVHLEVAEVPALLVWLAGISSYTGDDTAELSIVANPYLIERFLQAILAVPDVRLAQPGEFTARAYLRGKLSLAQAEGVAALIGAQSAEQLTAARGLLAGSTGAEYRSWADEVTTLLALVEAGIDFTDQEDVVAIAPSELALRTSALADSLERNMGGRSAEADPHTLPFVALAGRPNAGKSTLFNALLGRARAIASPVAGTTRDVLEEELDLSRDVPGAGSVMLVDLAGLSSHAGTSATDATAQSTARDALTRADVVLWCDPTGRFDEQDSHEFWGACPPTHPTPPPSPTPSILRVRTFADLPAPNAQHDITASIGVCAIDGWNLASLRRAIADQACTGRATGIAALLPRHRRAITSAAAALRRAESIAREDSASGRTHSPELTAGALREALDEIGQLVGAISPDDVIGRVFAVFCVGK